ncbi:hypothetical protein PAL_GLEAN10015176 [Pteropus alecto]|uniref:Uncharacterized protein n=1 Tax=Pteropus alecto TaxID=9402 RepID=L5JV26_PTEAL|nr:hypothetical protein PAL_GLEAN10015176 [Pteropus alecto]
MGTPERLTFLRLAAAHAPQAGAPRPYHMHSRQPWPHWAPIPPAPIWRTDAAVTAISFDCH